MRQCLALLVLVAGIYWLPRGAQAQWQPDGVPISTAANDQRNPTIISDGAGGAIVTWEDFRDVSHIYVQRVDALGVSQWSGDGVVLCTDANYQIGPTIVSDGAAGAIVTWFDFRNGGPDIYAQRVNASGIPLWTGDGVAICTAVDYQQVPRIVSDGVGGAIVTWQDDRSGVSDIYAQRVNASGVPQWAADGVTICTATSYQTSPAIVPDDAGGAIVTWEDWRSGAPDIYVQWVSASGVPQWTANGVAFCTAANFQLYPMIISDGAGGAICTWEDWRSGNADVYAQRVSALGVPQWTADGVALWVDANRKTSPAIVSDGAGGAIVTWQDYRSGSDIYAQRLDTAGAYQWATDGVAVCAADDGQQYPRMASDGAGGVIVTWEDFRSGYPNSDIYAQRVSAAGAPQWTADGVALCTDDSTQAAPMIVADGTGEAIVTWSDYRSGASDIYAQHVTAPLNAVAIASFDAVEVDGVVTLRSAFRSDLGVESVNVYRALGTGDDPLTVIERVGGVQGDGFEYADRDVAPGHSYRYQIGVVDADGEFFSPVVTVSVDAITGALSQNQPNPFNPTTTIRFVVPVSEQVTLAVYDTSGHLVRTLVDEVEGYGAHEVTWDGRDDEGVAMGSGVYFYRLQAGKHMESRKMVLLK